MRPLDWFLGTLLVLVIALVIGVVVYAIDESRELAARGTPETEVVSERCVAGEAGPGEFSAQRLLGRDLAGAERLAKSRGCSVRVVRRDGEALAGTSDVVRTRINVEVRRGVVTGIDRIG